MLMMESGDGNGRCFVHCFGETSWYEAPTFLTGNSVGAASEHGPSRTIFPIPCRQWNGSFVLHVVSFPQPRDPATAAHQHHGMPGENVRAELLPRHNHSDAPRHACPTEQRGGTAFPVRINYFQTEPYIGILRLVSAENHMIRPAIPFLPSLHSFHAHPFRQRRVGGAFGPARCGHARGEGDGTCV